LHGEPALLLQATSLAQLMDGLHILTQTSNFQRHVSRAEFRMRETEVMDGVGLGGQASCRQLGCDFHIFWATQANPSLFSPSTADKTSWHTFSLLNFLVKDGF
jgi:hypothetical protein